MITLGHSDILLMDSRKRASLINSLAGFKTAVLVGTKSESGIENLAIFNSLIHIGANPPLYGLLFRPHTVRRDTLENILQTGQYTFNFVSSKDAQSAHQTSAKYEAHISEFQQVDLQAEYMEGFSAPFVKNAPVQIAMQLEQQVPIPINNTLLIIGSVRHILLKENLLEEDGFVALHHADILACTGLDAYYKTEFLQRLPYAKP